MTKNPTNPATRREPAPRAGGGGRPNRRGKADATGGRRRPDSRAVALKMLSDFLIAGARPVTGRTPMPAPPRLPAGGAGFPRPGRSTPPMVASSPPPQIPFPALPPATAAGYPRPSAMAAIGRFLEAARAGGLADRHRRRG